MKSDTREPSAVRPVVAVGGVAVVDGALLLVRRAKHPQAGRWTIPGGHVEPGETLASAVEREMLEETGLRVSCAAFLGWVERLGPGYHFVILDFTVTVPADATAAVAGGDAAAVAWVPVADVPGLSLVDGVEEFLRTHGVLA
jgi:ADP-ribose pyrophosphatase YjhB (NUDIX family)